jgi:hypothetical protein
MKRGENIQYGGSTGIVGIKKQASVMCIQNFISVRYIYIHAIDYYTLAKKSETCSRK